MEPVRVAGTAPVLPADASRVAEGSSEPAGEPACLVPDERTARREALRALTAMIGREVFY